MNKNKHNMQEVTFLLKIRIDSTERLENTNAVVRFIEDNFDSSGIIILEADDTSKYSPDRDYLQLTHVFKEDKNSVFRLSYWTNRVIEMATTPYVAIWDADAICPPEQVVDAVSMLRGGTTVMSFSYDGRYYSCNKQLSMLYKNTGRMEALEYFRQSIPLMFGYHSVGGSFLVNKKKYMNAGGDNENIYGWGIEDAERVKRMEVLGMSVYRSKGAMYHLWHPRSNNSWYVDQYNELRNRKEFSITCATTDRFL